MGRVVRFLQSFFCGVYIDEAIAFVVTAYIFAVICYASKRLHLIHSPLSVLALVAVALVMVLVLAELAVSVVMVSVRLVVIVVMRLVVVVTRMVTPLQDYPPHLTIPQLSVH